MMPKNAAALVKKAAKLGYRARATYAIGYVQAGHASHTAWRPVRSVFVKIRTPDLRVAASWQGPLGPLDEVKLGFEQGWIKLPSRYPYRCGYAELSAALLEVPS